MMTGSPPPRKHGGGRGSQPRPSDGAAEPSRASAEGKEGGGFKHLHSPPPSSL